MLREMRKLKGQVLTARGPVKPGALGRVMMHEHLHSDIWDKPNDRLVWEERPATPERRQYLLDNSDLVDRDSLDV